MTEQTNAVAIVPVAPLAQTKAASVQKLLARAKGATLAEITDATGWLPHSSRAFLTGLRKKGNDLIREHRSSGETCWRIAR